MIVAKKTVCDKQACAGIANLKITGFYRLYGLFKIIYRAENLIGVFIGFMGVYENIN